MVKKLLVIFLLLALVWRFAKLENKASNYINGQSVSFHTTLFTEPKTSGNFQSFAVKDGNGTQVMVQTPRYPQFHYGQTLSILGTISLKSSKSASTQKGSLLNNKKIVPAIYFPKIEAVKNAENPLLAVVSSIRQNIILVLQKAFPEPFSSLLLGIVFGISTTLPKDLLDSMRISGVMHVIAASGMNVTLVANFLVLLFGFVFKRQVALVFSIFGILFYAALAGFQPSIVRAAIMGIAALSAQIFGRQNLAVYNLGIAGYLMLFISPDLISDIGFQLSFLSTLGLILFQPLFKTAIFTEEIATTICAQLATLPVLLANFGTYSLWSVVVNGLVLWTIPYVMILGGVGVFAAVIFEPLGKLILFLSLPFLYYFKFVVEFFGKLPQVVTITQVSWYVIAGYYLLLSSTLIFLFQRE